MSLKNARSGSGSNSGGATVPHSTTGRPFWCNIAAIRSHTARNAETSSRRAPVQRTSCSSTTTSPPKRASRRGPSVDVPAPLGPVSANSGSRRNGHRCPHRAHSSSAPAATGRSARSPHEGQIRRSRPTSVEEVLEETALAVALPVRPRRIRVAAAVALRRIRVAASPVALGRVRIATAVGPRRIGTAVATTLVGRWLVAIERTLRTGDRFELTAVQEDPAAALALVDVDAVLVHGPHLVLTLRTNHTSEPTHKRVSRRRGRTGGPPGRRRRGTSSAGRPAVSRPGRARARAPLPGP